MSSNESEIALLTAQAAYRAIPILKDRFEEVATTAGWPERIIQSIVIDFDGESLSVKYPDSIAEEVDDLEYGKPYGLPNPVIRPFVLRSDGIIKDIITDYILDEIMDIQGVI